MGVDTGNHNVVCKTFRYSFDDDGGAVGAVTLDGGGQMPDNAMVQRAWVENISAVSSEGEATIALGVTGATSALAVAADALDYDPDYFDIVALLGQFKTGAASSLVMTIADADLTAGEFDVHVEYLPGR